VPTVREVLEQGLPEGVSVEEVAAAVARIDAAGRAAWPGVIAADEAIAARLAARLRDDADLRASPGGPGGIDQHDADVFLAIALAAGDPAAVRVFEERFVPQIGHALRRLRLATTAVEEIVQALRFDLLVGEGAPKIADYAGRGELAAWLRVTATRRALTMLRRGGREESLDEILLDHWPDASPSPEGKHLRTKYTAELKRAIHEAFAALELRQRNLLRQHVLDELTIDDLARLYRAHRATCARWLADARAELGKGTRKRLIAALGLRFQEVESLLRYLDTDIELSISRIFRGDARESAGT
jgi:RNA polymerase sigma-70 factor